ncbi:MAG: 3-deoxy-manno-octulosonate cytidylyltransferase [Opitutales bacterium]|nr:3-deoxy-manno-octulosonate cytidylyltransferase [Opitutales bacterium]
MKNAVIAILQIMAWAIPAFVGLAFILRTNESYEDSYAASSVKVGMSLRAYKFLFKLIGVAIFLCAGGIFYYIHLYEPHEDISEKKKFWDGVKDSDGAIKTAMLLSAIAIPTRMGSTRFPGKPLASLGGKKVLERVYEKCAASKKAQGVFVLTDSPEIEDFCGKIGANCVMTSPACQNGTERIVEALPKIDAEFVVNVQGDEPFIPTSLIDSIFDIHEKTGCALATAATPIENPDELFNPNNVKVLTSASGKVIYFSRSPLPFVRGEQNPAEWLKRRKYLKHIGIYGYSRDTLIKYSRLPKSSLEACESLEQLRFVDAGIPIELVESDYKVVGIDTPEDLALAEKMLAQKE